MLRILLGTILTMSAITSCSILPPIKTTPQTSYVINTIPSNIPHCRSTTFNLSVNKPRASAAYNTTQMVYSEKPYQLGYFVKNRWAETPPQMFQPLIIKALENTHSFSSVISSATNNQYDYLINTEVVELQQDYVHSPHAVCFKLRAEIINAKNNTLVNSEELTVTQNMSQDTPYSGVIAANQATAIMLNKLADFVLRTLC